MTRGVGLDFGTTNSSLAIADADGRVSVARFEAASGPTPSFRSVLFLERADEKSSIESMAGPRAIERYLQAEDDRRLMQSLKSFLASGLFKATSVFGRTHTLEELIGQIALPLKHEAEQQLGPIAPPLVVGRPVRFVNARNEEDENRALSRLQAAIWQAGFPEVCFEYEPVAAAHHYEQGLDRDELVLIADFGGGTSDFCLLRVGPSLRERAREPEDILGNAGVAIAGDAFDAQLVRHLVAPALGRGSLRQVFMGKLVPLPNWIYRDLERWHHLSFLKSRKTMGFLYEALEGAREPEKIEALIHVVENDLGYGLYRAIQETKLELSEAETAHFRFEDPPVAIEARVGRAEFESWIGDELAQIAGCIDGLLEKTRIANTDVDRVFLTGGSAFVPAVRQIFRDRFGNERLTGGDELISVAAGLALRARSLGLRG